MTPTPSKTIKRTEDDVKKDAESKKEERSIDAIRKEFDETQGKGMKIADLNRLVEVNRNEREAREQKLNEMNRENVIAELQQENRSIAELHKREKELETHGTEDAAPNATGDTTGTLAPQTEERSVSGVKTEERSWDHANKNAPKKGAFLGSDEWTRQQMSNRQVNRSIEYIKDSGRRVNINNIATAISEVAEMMAAGMSERDIMVQRNINAATAPGASDESVANSIYGTTVSYTHLTLPTICSV